jgi:hypothetical protein
MLNLRQLLHMVCIAQICHIWHCWYSSWHYMDAEGGTFWYGDLISVSEWDRRFYLGYRCLEYLSLGIWLWLLSIDSFIHSVVDRTNVKVCLGFPVCPIEVSTILVNIFISTCTDELHESTTVFPCVSNNLPVVGDLLLSQIEISTICSGLVCLFTILKLT